MTDLHMPTLSGATRWLNSDPLVTAELEGQVVLVDFWTLTCINWLRTAPYIRAWSRAYRDDGLVVIGAHTPEFSFEHELDLGWPLIGGFAAERVIGPQFVEAIARRTLHRVKVLAEAGS